MKTGKTFLVLSLAAGLCVSGSVQAFCFMKNNNSGRSHNYYSYPMPAAAFAPAQYYAYPDSMLPASTRYGGIRPALVPGQQGYSPINAVRDRR
ncbi:MAG: hypothetical protein HKP57_02055 [Halobacteria archaeon]|nr:hypothetical protein [Halobacteria archaeon]